MIRRLPGAVFVGLFLAMGGAGGELLTNGGMESPFVDGIAHEWGKNCYGQNVVVFSPGPPRSGEHSQRVECRSYRSGAIQFRAPLAIAKGKHYRISCRLRADGGVAAVNAAIRHGPAPYTQHLSAAFEPGEDWEEFTFEGIALESDDQAGLFFWLQPAGTGTLWVDDVSVVESEAIAHEGPPPCGNVLPNASFEVDWRRAWRSTPTQPSVDPDRPFHGRQSLRWDINSRPVRFVSQLVEFAGGDKPLALRLAARTNGNVTLTATLWPGVRLDGTTPVLRARCEPKPDWAVFEARGAVPSSPNGAYYLEITLDGKEGASAWLDGVRLEPDEAAGAMRCRRPLEASLSCDPPAHILRRGQPVMLRAAAFNDDDHRRTAALTCRVTDSNRQVVCEAPVELTLDAKRGAEAAVTLPISGTGVFLAELLDGEDVLSELSMSVLPLVSPVPPEASAVGGHFRLDEFHLSVAAAMGVKWTRIHDCEDFTHWNTAEPEKGRFVWFDDKTRLARQHRVKLLGEFLRVPRWASSAGADVTGDSVHRKPPRDLDEFAAYVRAVVEHYKGDIRDWEIWNEPYHDGFWQGTPQQYAEMARVACRAVHAADPDAKTLAPCAYPGTVEWVDDVFATGGLTDADVFSYHGYDLFNPESYRRVEHWAARGRTTPMPIWNTETGVTSRTFYRGLPDRFTDPYTNWLRPMACDVAAEQSAKLFIMALAGGARRYFHYWCVWEDTLLPRTSGMTVFEYDGSLRPMAVSYAVAASLLDGTRGEGWIELPGPALANLLRDERRMIAVLWRQGGRRQRRFVVPLNPSTLDARDMWGNSVPLERSATGFEITLTGRPLYLITPVANAKTLIDALGQTKMVE